MIQCRQLTENDDLTTVGELIYHTDPWVYPDLFGDAETARKAASAIITTETVYHYRHITIAEEDGKIAGYMTLLRAVPQENTENFRKAILAAAGDVPPKFDRVVKGYFDCIRPDPDKTEILSLSVLPSFRRRGVAETLLSQLRGDTTYTLACVRDNEPARKLYAKCGFTLLYEYPGYTDVPCVELIKEKRL